MRHHIGGQRHLARVVWLWADDVLALTKEEKVVTVTIADTDTMGEITQKAGPGRFGPLSPPFYFYSDLTGAREKISAGTFKLNCMYDYHALVNALGRSSSDRKVVTVTIPEGYECRQIFELLEKKRGLYRGGAAQCGPERRSGRVLVPEGCEAGRSQLSGGLPVPGYLRFLYFR